MATNVNFSLVAICMWGCLDPLSQINNCAFSLKIQKFQVIVQSTRTSVTTKD